MRKTDSVLKARLANVLIRHVEPIFKADAQITLVVRTPGNNNADVLITSEQDLEEVKAVIDRSIGREATA